MDDKNRTIQALKQRLMNQQLQLAYYLHKNLGNNSVTDFSAACAPQLTEENMNLSLAMYKFVKDNGGKNKLNILHEKLHEYDERVSELLAKQEELVKNASKNCLEKEIIKEDENEFLHADRACRIAHLDLYSRIMNATVQVKKELEDLREYSEKVVNLENERNALVDYVFSLPAEQRLAGLNIIENMKGRKLPSTHESESCSKKSSQQEFNPNFLGYQLNTVLSTMENEAVSLVSLNEEQRNIYIDELEKLRAENMRLNELLQVAAETNDTSKVFELEQKCNRIENDLHEVRRGLEAEVIDKDREIERLNGELKLAIDQTMQLEEQIIELKNTVDAVVFENEQLNDTLNELNKQDGNEKVDELQDIIKDQHEQLKNLMLIMCNLTEDEKEIFEDSGIASSKTDGSRDGTPEEKPQRKQSVYSNVGRGISSSYPQLLKEKTKQTRIKRSIQKTETSTSTSIRVESCDPDGKKETMKAILESSNTLEGILEMDNSSKLKLRLRCTNSTPATPVPSSSKTVLTLHDKQNYICSEGISQQLDNIKKEMDLTLKQPNGKKTIIDNIRNIYFQLFGVKEGSFHTV